MGYFTLLFQPRLRFGIRTLLAAMVLAALACWLYRYSAEVFWLAVIAAGAANLLGWIAGWFVTVVLRLPNDGSAPPGCDVDDEPA